MTDDAYSNLTNQPEKEIIIREGSNAVTWYLYSVQTSDTNGKINWIDLTDEGYYLVEVKAPDGYNLDAEPRHVARTANEETITITNTAGYVLPKSGGIGTFAYTVAGLALIGGAAVLLMRRRRRARI